MKSKVSGKLAILYAYKIGWPPLDTHCSDAVLSSFLQTTPNTRILREMGFWPSYDLKIQNPRVKPFGHDGWNKSLLQVWVKGHWRILCYIVLRTLAWGASRVALPSERKQRILELFIKFIVLHRFRTTVYVIHLKIQPCPIGRWLSPRQGAQYYFLAPIWSPWT